TKRLDDAGHRGSLLADGDVDADDAVALLIDDGVESESGLTGLAVADDQFPLSPSDGGHGIDGFDTGLEGLLYRLPVDDAGRHAFDGCGGCAFDGSASVDRLAEGIDDPSDECVSDETTGDFAGPADRVAFGHFQVIAEENGADVV